MPGDERSSGFWSQFPCNFRIKAIKFGLQMPVIFLIQSGVIRIKLHKSPAHIGGDHTGILHGTPHVGIQIPVMTIMGITFMRAMEKFNPFRRIHNTEIATPTFSHTVDQRILKWHISDTEISRTPHGCLHGRHRRIEILRICPVGQHRIDFPTVAGNAFKQITLRLDADSQRAVRPLSATRLERQHRHKDNNPLKFHTFHHDAKLTNLTLIRE